MIGILALSILVKISEYVLYDYAQAITKLEWMASITSSFIAVDRNFRIYAITNWSIACLAIPRIWRQPLWMLGDQQ